MARIRTIKPGFFLDDRLAQLPILARYIYPGLWTLADRFGRLEDRPARIKACLLPYDDADIGELLGELEAGGYILRYEVDGGRYIAIPGFTEHQRINGKEAKEESKIPPPPENTGEKCNREATEKQPGSDREALGKHSGSNREAPVKKSRSDREAQEYGKERKGKEGNGILPAPDKPEPGANLAADLWTTLAQYNQRNGKLWYSSFPREREGVKRLAKLIATAAPPGQADEFARRIIETFLRLRDGSDPFWRGQPVTPSIIGAAGVFERIVQAMEAAPKAPTLDWIDQILSEGPGTRAEGLNGKNHDEALSGATLPHVNRLTNEVTA